MSLEKESGSNECREETKPLFTVLAAYQRLCEAARALDVFQTLRRDLGDIFDVHCDRRCFNTLNTPEARETAILRGTAADVVIVATLCSTDLPATVKDWLNRMVEGRTMGSGVLVGLLVSYSGIRDARRR